MSKEIVERQAQLLAKDNKLAEPAIQRIFWFPDSEEVRLVELTNEIPVSGDGNLHPYYFRANITENLPVASGIALIRPEEFGKLRLPEKWGQWQSAVELKVGA